MEKMRGYWSVPPRVRDHMQCKRAALTVRQGRAGTLQWTKVIHRAETCIFELSEEVQHNTTVNPFSWLDWK